MGWPVLRSKLWRNLFPFFNSFFFFYLLLVRSISIVASEILRHGAGRVDNQGSFVGLGPDVVVLDWRSSCFSFFLDLLFFFLLVIVDRFSGSGCLFVHEVVGGVGARVGADALLNNIDAVTNYVNL